MPKKTDSKKGQSWSEYAWMAAGLFIMGALAWYYGRRLSFIAVNGHDPQAAEELRIPASEEH